MEKSFFFGCWWGTQRFKRSPEIPGVISDYVKGDSVRLIRACGAGSSCAPPAAGLCPSLPSPDFRLVLSQPGHFPERPQGCRGHGCGQSRGSQAATGGCLARCSCSCCKVSAGGAPRERLWFRRNLSHPCSSGFLGFDPLVALCCGAGEGLQGYDTSWGVWRRAGTSNVGKLRFYRWDVRLMLDVWGMKLITGGVLLGFA